MGAADYFSIPIFFIIFRETTEAAIIVSVLLSFLRQVLSDDQAMRKRLARQVPFFSYQIVTRREKERQSAHAHTHTHSNSRSLSHLVPLCLQKQVCFVVHRIANSHPETLPPPPIVTNIGLGRYCPWSPGIHCYWSGVYCGLVSVLQRKNAAPSFLS